MRNNRMRVGVVGWTMSLSSTGSSAATTTSPTSPTHRGTVLWVTGGGGGGGGSHLQGMCSVKWCDKSVCYFRWMRFLPGRCTAKGRGPRSAWTDWWTKGCTRRRSRCTRSDVLHPLFKSGEKARAPFPSTINRFFSVVFFPPTGPLQAPEERHPPRWAEPEAGSPPLLGPLV